MDGLRVGIVGARFAAEFHLNAYRRRCSTCVDLCRADALSMVERAA